MPKVLLIEDDRELRRDLHIAGTLPATGSFRAAYRRGAWRRGLDWAVRRLRSRVRRVVDADAADAGHGFQTLLEGVDGAFAPWIDRCRGDGRGIKRPCKDQGRQNKQGPHGGIPSAVVE